MEKKCNKCEKTKSVDSFYVHREMKDGRLSFCKGCVKKRVSKYASTEQGKAVARAWYKTPKGKAKLKRHTKKFRRLNPEKGKAHSKASYALKTGKLIKKPCRICGEKKSEMHHPNYGEPFNIDWLCREHHRKIYHIDFYKNY